MARGIMFFPIDAHQIGLECADPDRPRCIREDAFRLAKLFCGAEQSACPSQHICLPQRSYPAQIILMHNLADEPGDVDVCRAGLRARRIFTLQASGGLIPDGVRSEA